MGTRTLIGTYDGTTEAAVMVDPVNGVAFGPLFEGPDAAEQIDAFAEWLRRLGYVNETDQIGLTSNDLPTPFGTEGDDPRQWPYSGLVKLVRFWKANVWEAVAS